VPKEHTKFYIFPQNMLLYSHGTRNEVNKLNKIKFYRNNLGFSVYEIAKLAGLTASYISNLENDNRTNPSREAMQKISNALKESVQAVFFPDDEKETS